jgi:hypothetical protein
MNSRVVVSCENLQELDSILSVLLVDYLAEDIVIFGTVALYGPGLEGEFYRNCRVVGVRRIFNGVFKKSNPVKRILESICIAYQLSRLLRKLDVDVLVVGVSLIYHRLVKKFMGDKILIVSIVRSVIVGGDGASFASSIKSSVFNALGLGHYLADSYICTGPVTEKFLNGVGANNIYTVGPFDVDYTLPSRVKDPRYLDTVVFITGAYSWHGDEYGQGVQVELVRKLKFFLATKGVGLKVLVHPRDSLDVYGFSDGVIEGGLAKCIELEANTDGILFVSMASTLSFELAYLGFRSVLLSSPEFYRKHADWYRKVGVSPLFKFEELFEGGSIDYCKVFGNSFKGRVLEESCRLVKSMGLKANG